MLKQILLFATITSSSAAYSQDVKGDENIKTENRETGEYEAIKIGGSFHVVLIDGEEGKLTIASDVNILPYVVTEVTKNTLNVYMKNDAPKSYNELKVSIPVVDINKLVLEGSADIETKTTLKTNTLDITIEGSGNIKGAAETKKLNVKIEGSGNIKLAGTAEELICEIDGSGNADLMPLTAKKTNIKIEGSGNVTTNTTDYLEINIKGSGNVKYKNKPAKLNQKINGSGTAESIAK